MSVHGISRSAARLMQAPEQLQGFSEDPPRSLSHLLPNFGLAHFDLGTAVFQPSR